MNSAPYIIADINEIGDSRLSPEESVIRLREENDSLLDNRRIHRQAELSDPNRAAGPRISWNDLLYRLHKCNPALLYKDGTPGNIAVYVPKDRQEIAEHEYDQSRPDWWNDHKYAGGIPKDWIPEYSVLEVNERNLPVREHRGYRSVLLALLAAGAITPDQADKHFGPALGPRSWSWHQQIHDLKEIKTNG